MATLSNHCSGLAKQFILMFLGAVFVLNHVRAADPDPLQDFCIADINASNSIPTNGYLCKARSLVTADDFTFTGLREKGDTVVTGTNATITYALVQQYPGVNTQGISHVRLDFEPGGVIPPHTHPLASETIFVVEGSVFTGFVSHDNKLFTKTLHKGDVFLFPRATLHFQLCVGNVSAITFNSFNAQFPGLLMAANQLFVTNMNHDVLAKSFGSNEAVMNAVNASIPRFWG
ncbi:germin-like protein subfamily 2 member 3 [Physcomitrium patens]|uniref:Germin-like protein n=1 Tax=Physcomitrium patens TaxID=3218 RepID=A9RX44_PHYPA|nr:germin-like protein subfamily 2 member 3 [Physcomitrium patens]PNR35408.1 hypothetical protein PHYPA_023308 [Physcomitrium patens]|eukprot:XP_024402325.1 germin-like protein subfamily 2 member 3 [Physcomitrella patens]